MNTHERVDSPLALALDFGGTKLLAGIVELATGAVLARWQKQTPVQRGAEASIEAMLECAMAVLANTQSALNRLRGIGISFGGPVQADRKAVVKSMHVLGWENLPLPDRISSAVGLPAIMDNDANAAALGEARFGAGRCARNLVYVQVSTGIGSGVVIGGRLYRGQGQAGELGHITIVPGGPMCVCGRQGCLESIASGWAIARQGCEELARAYPSSPLRILCTDSIDRLDARLVVQASREGDVRAQRIVLQALEALASAIGIVICALDPEVVVVGGGLGKGMEVFADDVRAEVDRHLPATLTHRTRVEFSRFGDNAALVGAACLLEEDTS